MEPIRKPFQGVSNIIRFNWHFYTLSLLLILSLVGLRIIVAHPYNFYLSLLAIFIGVSVFFSLLTSFYIYDLSTLYTLSWLDFIQDNLSQEIVTINAGFDETSVLLQRKFQTAHLHVFDFFNPDLHTEVSIKRARKAYPAYPNTQTIETSAIPLQNQTANYIFLILAAHEIRHDIERIHFFKELNRILKPSGKIIVVEHLRDTINFLAYNIGFLHFLSEATWTSTFTKAELSICRQLNVTPFITTFVLEKDGSAS